MNKDQKLRVMMTLSDKLDGQSAMIISNKLESTDDNAASAIMMTKLYEKLIVILLSVFLGGFGADRFYLKDYGLGVLKLVAGIITYACLIGGVLLLVPAVSMIGTLMMLVYSIWLLVDIFLSYKQVGKKNFNNIMNVLAMYPAREEDKVSTDRAFDIFS